MSIKLCYASFESILRLCTAGNDKRSHNISRKILQSVDEEYFKEPKEEIYGEKKAFKRKITTLLSHLRNCETDLLKEMKEGAKAVDPYDEAWYFEEYIVKHSLSADENKLKLIVLALLDIIKNDKTITDTTILDKKNQKTKPDILEQKEKGPGFILSDFLSGIFLYVASEVDNRDGQSNDEITEEYINSFSTEIDKISLLKKRPEEHRGINELNPSDYGLPALGIAKKPVKTEEIKEEYYNKFFLTSTRKSELEVIGRNFTGNKIIFLCGHGGLGKSELARRYAYLHADKYEDIYFVEYDESGLQTSFHKFAVKKFGLNSEDEKTNTEFLLKLLRDPDKLLIIDNFDCYKKIKDGKECRVPAIEDENLRDFLETVECNVIFTTRNQKDRIERFQSNLIACEVPALDIDESKELFYQNCGKGKGDTDGEYLVGILEKLERHTLTVILLAQLVDAGADLKEIKDNLDKNKFEEFIENNITEIDAPGLYKKKSLDEHLGSLYNMANLTEEKKYILENLSFIESGSIDKTIFLNWIGIKNNFTDMQELIYTRLIEETKGEISLHSMVRYIVKLNRDKELGKYNTLVQSIKETAKGYEKNSGGINMWIAEIGKNLSKQMGEKGGSPECAHKRLERAEFNLAVGHAMFKTVQYSYELEELYESAKEIFAEYKKYDERVAQLYDNLYSLYTFPGKIENALSVKKEEYKILENLPENTEFDSEKIIQRKLAVIAAIASSHNDQDSFFEAINCCAEGEKLIRENAGLDKTKAAAGLYHKMTVSFLGLDNIYMALECACKYNGIAEAELKKNGTESNKIEAADSLGILAIVFDKLQTKTALDYKMKALELRKEVQEENHPDIARILNRIGLSHGALHNREEERKYKEDALEMRRRALGNNNNSVAVSLNNVGCTYVKLGNYEKGFDFFTEAYNIRKGKNQQSLTERIGLVYNMAITKFNLHDRDAAWEYIQEIFRLITDNRGKNFCLKFPPLSNFHNEVLEANDAMKEWMIEEIRKKNKKA